MKPFTCTLPSDLKNCFDLIIEVFHMNDAIQKLLCFTTITAVELTQQSHQFSWVNIPSKPEHANFSQANATLLAHFGLYRCLDIKVFDLWYNYFCVFRIMSLHVFPIPYIQRQRIV